MFWLLPSDSDTPTENCPLCNQLHGSNMNCVSCITEAYGRNAFRAWAHMVAAQEKGEQPKE